MNRGCFYCSQEGHFARNCPRKEADRLKQLECFACGGRGHMKRNCPFLVGEDKNFFRSTSNERSKYSRSSGSPSGAAVALNPEDGVQRRCNKEHGGYRLGSASEALAQPPRRSYSSVVEKSKQTVSDNPEISAHNHWQNKSNCQDGVGVTEHVQGADRTLEAIHLASDIDRKTEDISCGDFEPAGDDMSNESNPSSGRRSIGGGSSEGVQKSSVSRRVGAEPEKRRRSHYPPFIDTHCHLEYVFERYHHQGTFEDFADHHRYPTNFEGCITTFCDPAAFSSLGSWTELLSEPSVWGSFGIHPHNAKYFHSNGLEDKLLEALQHPKCVAFGEIGLDYSEHSPSDPTTQREILKHQLQLVVAFGKPLVLHCRGAEQDLFQILTETLPREWFIHLHCFTGDPQMAAQYLAEFPNLYLGICGNVTNLRQVNMRTVSSSMPLERLLIETDAPYHVPSNLPKAGWCRNSHPALAFYVAKEIANLRKMDLTDVLNRVRTNTRTLYGV